MWEAVKLSNLDKEKHPQDKTEEERKQQQIKQTPSLKEKIQSLPSCTKIKLEVNRKISTLFSRGNSNGKKIDNKEEQKKTTVKATYSPL